jgi:sulfite exporter TauE/SafE
MIFHSVVGFLIGLQATLHCVGMCGPLALAAPIDRRTRSRALWGSLSYNIGRISTYTYLGFLLGLIGFSSILLEGVQIISVLSGLIFISSAFIGSIETWGFLRPITVLIAQLNSSLFPSVKKAPTFFRPYLFGVLNGLLPCGMVYLALLYSFSSTNLFESTLSMFFFGLGTIPVMFFIPIIGQKKFYAFLPRNTQKILLGLLGFLLILRGFGLGIPYLSPRIDKPSEPHTKPSIECCDIQK